jgi:hypothetical protein
MPRSRYTLSNSRSRQEEIVLLHRAEKQIDHAQQYLLPALNDAVTSHWIETLSANLETCRLIVQDQMDKHLLHYRKPDYDLRRRENTKKRLPQTEPRRRKDGTTF